MDYEKKYKDALANARQEYTTTENVERKQWLEELFPELKKSKNERIKKRILLSLEKDLMATKNSGCDTQDLEQCIAWLEKQSEQKTAVVDFNAKDWYVSKVDGKIHDITYNPTDMVEPKFKVGDWIVNDYCMGRVVEITNDAYLLDIGQGIPFSCEDKVHLWTIADANEGNILAGKIDGDNYILIFKTVKDGWIETYGHYYNAVNRFCVPSQLFCRSYQGTFTPATKEQRDLLFQKMKEAGYEWDAEKKELKLLITNGGDFEPKQEWSEKDEKIRKALIRFHKSTIDIDGIKGDDIIAWLEKQEWNEEDEEMCQETIDWFEKKCFPYALEEENPARESIKWLKLLKDRLSNVKKNIKTFA